MHGVQVAQQCPPPLPAGPDSISRKWALVLWQLVLAAAMVLTGLVTAFPLLVAHHGRKLPC